MCVFSLLQIISTMQAQTTQTMQQKENLKGKVKSVHITNGTDEYIKVYFDETGKITKKEDYVSRGRVLVSDYVYDENGRLISVKVGDSEWNYLYDENGRLVSFRMFDNTYCYDEKGNCYHEIRHSNNAGDKYIERVYNEKNQLVEAYSHWGAERLMNVWRTDSSGRRAYEETTFGEPKKETHTFFQYNKFGDVSNITIQAGFSAGTVDVVYDKYDDAGNWLEQRVLSENFESPQDLSHYFEIYNTYFFGNRITRTIEYYE